MLYVICDPVAEKEKLSFIGHTEEMSSERKKTGFEQRERQRLLHEEEASRGKEGSTRRDADHTLRESPISAAANMCPLHP